MHAMFQARPFIRAQVGLVPAQQLDLEGCEGVGQVLLYRWPLLTRGLVKLAHDQRLHTFGLVEVV
ncbi:hypothetical protein D3C75_1141880 [compost metagenome]